MTANDSDRSNSFVAVPLTVEARKAAAARSRLRHSWLENQLLDRDPKVIADRQRSISVQQSFAEKIRQNGEFAKSLGQARKFCDSIACSLSPALILRTHPLASLPQSMSDEVGSVLHEHYLKVSCVEAIRLELSATIDEFTIALATFTDVWDRVPRSNECEIAEGFEKLQEAGRRLHRALGRVPEGTVLP